jgi:transposase
VIGWKKRYAAEGIAGLDDRPKPGRPAQIEEVAVVLATLEPPPGTTLVYAYHGHIRTTPIRDTALRNRDVGVNWWLSPQRRNGFTPTLWQRAREVG